MKKIKLITDSTADLSEVLLKEHAIEVVPLIVTIGDETFYDGITLNTELMYDKVEETNQMPKTAAASPGTFVEVFEKYLKDDYEIIYIGIGSKFSGTYQSAHTAKNIINSDAVHLVDSSNLSSGSGLLLLKAAKLRDEGKDIDTVVETLKTYIPKVRSQFVIDTLDYLHKGGRINGLQNMMGSMLRLKPIIKVRDGEMQVGKKARGNLKNGIKLLIKEVLDQKDQLDNDFLMITHSLNKDAAEYIRKELAEVLPIKNIYETPAGCVISSHCGRGTIGILYILK